MAQDPYQRPMSLGESENLLRSADNWEATKRGWAADFGILALVIVAIGGAVLGLLGVAAVAGAVVAVVAFVVAVFIWHDRK